MPHFLVARRKPCYKTLHKTAARALSEYKTDAAIEGLKAAMKKPDEHLRLDAATALFCSEHSKAFDLLLTMKSDSFDLVRSRVAQGLSRTKSEPNNRLLCEMVEKESEDIRQSAYGSIICREQ